MAMTHRAANLMSPDDSFLLMTNHRRVDPAHSIKNASSVNTKTNLFAPFPNGPTKQILAANTDTKILNTVSVSTWFGLGIPAGVVPAPRKRQKGPQ